MAELGAFAGRTGEVFGWLGTRGLAPAGAPFLKYNVIDMVRQLEVEAGVPVAAPVAGRADELACPHRCLRQPGRSRLTQWAAGRPERMRPGTCAGRRLAACPASVTLVIAVPLGNGLHLHELATSS